MTTVMNMQSFEKLLGICTGFGGKYNPGRQNLRVENLSVMLDQARDPQHPSQPKTVTLVAGRWCVILVTGKDLVPTQPTLRSCYKRSSWSPATSLPTRSCR